LSSATKPVREPWNAGAAQLEIEKKQALADRSTRPKKASQRVAAYLLYLTSLAGHRRSARQCPGCSLHSWSALAIFRSLLFESQQYIEMPAEAPGFKPQAIF